LYGKAGVGGPLSHLCARLTRARTQVVGLGQLGKAGGSGRLRLVANQSKLKISAKNAKKARQSGYGGTTSGLATSGLQSSLAFTPVQVGGWVAGDVLQWCLLVRAEALATRSLQSSLAFTPVQVGGWVAGDRLQWCLLVRAEACRHCWPSRLSRWVGGWVAGAVLQWCLLVRAAVVQALAMRGL